MKWMLFLGMMGLWEHNIWSKEMWSFCFWLWNCNIFGSFWCII